MGFAKVLIMRWSSSRLCNEADAWQWTLRLNCINCTNQTAAHQCWKLIAHKLNRRTFATLQSMFFDSSQICITLWALIARVNVSWDVVQSRKVKVVATIQLKVFLSDFNGRTDATLWRMLTRLCAPRRWRRNGKLRETSPIKFYGRNSLLQRNQQSVDNASLGLTQRISPRCRP